MIPEPFARWLWRALYNALLLPLLRAGARVAALRSAKLRETLAGQRGAVARLEAALAGRDAARPLLWFHVASAGELLQAQPVLERFLAAGTPCVLTVTSVSGVRWARRHWDAARRPAGLLAVDFLPPDTAANARRLLRTLRPTALVFTKYDLWPNLVWEAARAGVPQYLLAATLQPRSWRERSALARSFYGTLYAPMAGIFAVTEADAARFLRAAPGHAGVAVLGDTRFDSVLERRARIAPPPLPPYDGADAPGGAGSSGAGPAGAAQGPVLVVGSAWPPDEERVFPALREALARYPGLRALVVPHEIDAGHLAAIEAAFGPSPAGPGVPTARFTALGPGAASWRLLVVDAVGVLSALYAHASLAYVGGAFTTGVHNVMEPAAMGAPPIFGPFHQNSPEALHLLAQGLAFAIHDADGFRRVLFSLLDDPARTAALGARARAYVESQAGAAERSCARIRGELGLASGSAAAPEAAPAFPPASPFGVR
jgi:3-deoxy-D-manno-octulosonic-acid transferase